MSTRANIFLDYNGERIQYYHHHDGYPEGVGKLLASFLNIALFTAPERTTEGVKNQFLELLKLDEEFEVEEIGLHGDIEYLYFVKFNENEKDVITFTKLKWENKPEQLSKLERAEQGEQKLELELKIADTADE